MQKKGHRKNQIKSKHSKNIFDFQFKKTKRGQGYGHSAEALTCIIFSITTQTPKIGIMEMQIKKCNQRSVLCCSFII